MLGQAALVLCASFILFIPAVFLGWMFVNSDEEEQ